MNQAKSANTWKIDDRFHAPGKTFTAPGNTIIIDHEANEPIPYDGNFISLYFPASEQEPLTTTRASAERVLVYTGILHMLALLVIATPFMMVAEFVSTQKQTASNWLRFIAGFIPTLLTRELAIVMGVWNTSTFLTGNLLRMLFGWTKLFPEA